MENQFQKWVNISYVAVGVLVYFIVNTLLMKLVGTYDLEARIRYVDFIVRGISIVLGLVAFLIPYLNQQANQFMNEVVVELSRVSWPTQKDTTKATGVVLVMVLISGLFLGFMDYAWTLLLKWIL